MRIVDLTLVVDAQMPGVRISVAKQLEIDGWNASTLELYSHCGTHMDAPCHFVPGANTIDEQLLGVVMGPAHVINFSHVQPKQQLSVEDFLPVADRIQAGCRLLLRTDWYRRYGTPEYRDALPRISAELARWFVERKVGLLGVEQPSVADVNNLPEVTEVHQILFHGGVVIVEGLANLDQLTQPVVEFIALPLRIRGGDGSPVRAVARESSEGAGR